MFIRQPGLGKQSQQVTSRLSGEHNDKSILFSQSCGAKLECWEINIGRFMPHACQFDSVMKLHVDLDEFAIVHAVLFLSEGLHEENVVYHMCMYGLTSVF